MDIILLQDHVTKKYIDQKVELDVSSTFYPALCLLYFFCIGLELKL